MLRNGRVLHPADPASLVIAALNERIQNDERVENLLLPIRDGVMLAYRR
jgi:predicted O-methyltransferase YrrM